jgi:uncharacterized protein (TIGR00251 family)
MRLAVHVTPKSSRDEVAGWRGGELSVRVSAAPESGKANAAVCAVLARALGVSKSSVRVVRGETSRHKQLELKGIDEDALRAVFGFPEEPLF